MSWDRARAILATRLSSRRARSPLWSRRALMSSMTRCSAASTSVGSGSAAAAEAFGTSGDVPAAAPEDGRTTTAAMDSDIRALLDQRRRSSDISTLWCGGTGPDGDRWSRPGQRDGWTTGALPYRLWVEMGSMATARSQRAAGSPIHALDRMSYYVGRQTIFHRGVPARSASPPARATSRGDSGSQETGQS